MDISEQFTGCTISSHQCRCLEKLTDEERILLDSNSFIIKYKKGETICKQGSFASHVIYVEKGLVKVYLEKAENSLVLSIIPDGNLIGLLSLSDEQRVFQYSVMAYVDSEIRQINMDFFLKLINRNPDFAKEVIQVISSTSAQINGRFFCLTYKQSFGRLADIVLCLAEKIFKNEEFELPLSRKDLAELTGMSPETVIRMLKQLKESGLIEQKGKKYRILDFTRLKQISDKG